MPTIRVRLFAGLHQMIGVREVELSVPDGATVAALTAALGEQYPQVKPFLPSLVCAVAEEYVPSDHVLFEGDSVALIPPVSGGL
jgi:sulfur-carrier protein